LWFSVHRVCIAGEAKEVPTGPLCKICGVTLEVWPLEATQDKLDKFEQNEGFRTEVLSVRQGVVAAGMHERAGTMKRQGVESNHMFGQRVSIKAALVTDEVFTVHFSMPVDSVVAHCDTLQRATILGPFNVSLQGVLFHIWSLPPTLPHYVVEMFCQMERVLHDQLLQPVDCLRVGHASDRHSYALKVLEKDRNSSAPGLGSPFGLPQYDDIRKVVANVQAQRTREAEAGAVSMHERLQRGEDN